MWSRSGFLGVVAEALRARRVAQLRERLGFDLADALARDAELLAHLFERPYLPVVEAEAQSHHLLLTRVELGERLLDLVLQSFALGGEVGRDRGLVGHEVAEIAVVFFADRRL